MKQDILQDIHRIYDLGKPELGDSILADYLASAMQVKKPTIVYSSEPRSSWGGLSRHGDDKILTIYGYGGSDSTDRMQTIAHEMWHVRQHELGDSGDKRGELYEMNFRHYVKYSDDDEGYYRQLVEEEARRFEHVFKDVMIYGAPSTLPRRVEDHPAEPNVSRSDHASQESLVDWSLSREDAIANFIKKMKENI